MLHVSTSRILVLCGVRNGYCKVYENYYYAKDVETELKLWNEKVHVGTCLMTYLCYESIVVRNYF